MGNRHQDLIIILSDVFELWTLYICLQNFVNQIILDSVPFLIPIMFVNAITDQHLLTVKSNSF